MIRYQTVYVPPESLEWCSRGDTPRMWRMISAIHGRNSMPKAPVLQYRRFLTN